MDGTVGKLPLRRELARHVPPALISQLKKGFGVPLGAWLRGRLSDRFQERVVENPVVFGDTSDRGVVREIYELHCAGADRTQQLWNPLTLQEWAARHLRPV